MAYTRFLMPYRPLQYFFSLCAIFWRGSWRGSTRSCVGSTGEVAVFSRPWRFCDEDDNRIGTTSCHRWKNMSDKPPQSRRGDTRFRCIPSSVFIVVSCLSFFCRSKAAIRSNSSVKTFAMRASSSSTASATVCSPVEFDGRLRSGATFVKTRSTKAGFRLFTPTGEANSGCTLSEFHDEVRTSPLLEVGADDPSCEPRSGASAGAPRLLSTAS
mmetsp:Transcript_22203/g.55976  ORF Transcript_22203/g.55976 Transcript_22203/m.55976 type:complete len:213 (+) Transcript_22203:755-1393(+)